MYELQGMYCKSYHSNLLACLCIVYTRGGSRLVGGGGLSQSQSYVVLPTNRAGGDGAIRVFLLTEGLL